jgi:tripartite-type tricarboxylate transporter receptor subunit TctC
MCENSTSYYGGVDHNCTTGSGGKRDCALVEKTMITQRAFLTALACVGFGFNAVIAASAQVYPLRPITVVVPASAGGGAGEAMLRMMAERMRASLGQPVIIDNVGGASGQIGVSRVARAAPDGYTLILGNWSTHVANGAVYALTYDLMKDFEPITLIAINPLVIAAKKTMPARDLRELIAWLKANPDKASQGTNGPGSAMHLAGVFLQRQTGTRFAFVPYRGSAGIPDLTAGQIDMVIDLAASVIPQVLSGDIKAYAVTDKNRLAAAPDIPTVDEAGLPGLYISGWNALFAPKGTPHTIVGKLNAAAVDALADPMVHARIADLGQDIPRREQQTPEALGAFQKAEIEKWWPMIKELGIRAE